MSAPRIPAFATIAGWCAYTGMSRTGTNDALARGDLRAKKLGTRTLIDVQHGLAWLQSLPDAAFKRPGSCADARP